MALAEDPSCFPEQRVRPWVVNEEEEKAISRAMGDLERTLNMTTVLKSTPGLSEVDKTLPDDTRAESFYNALRMLQRDGDLEAEGLPPVGSIKPIGEYYQDLFHSGKFAAMAQGASKDGSLNNYNDTRDRGDRKDSSSSIESEKEDENEEEEEEEEEEEMLLVKDLEVSVLLDELLERAQEACDHGGNDDDDDDDDDAAGKNGTTTTAIRESKGKQGPSAVPPPLDISRIKIDGSIREQDCLIKPSSRVAYSTHSRGSARSAISRLSALTGKSYLNHQIRQAQEKKLEEMQQKEKDGESDTHLKRPGVLELAKDPSITKVHERLKELKKKGKKKASQDTAGKSRPRRASWMSRNALKAREDNCDVEGYALGTAKSLSSLAVAPSYQTPLVPSSNEGQGSGGNAKKQEQNEERTKSIPPSERPKTLEAALHSSRSDSSLLHRRPQTSSHVSESQGGGAVRGLRSLLASSSTQSLPSGMSVQRELQRALTAAAENGVKPEDQLRNARILTKKMKAYNTIDHTWDLFDGSRPLKNGIKALTTARQREDCWRSEISRQQLLATTPEFVEQLAQGPLFPEFHIKKNRGLTS